MPSLPFERRDDSYSGLVPLLAGLFGALLFICLVGLVWCIIRRKKHRAPIVPYHLHTIVPKSSNNTALEGTSTTEGERQAGQEQEQGQEGSGNGKSKRPPPFGQEGRGVGYGFNPVFREAYGGGGGAESGEEGYAAQRVGPMWG